MSKKGHVKRKREQVLDEKKKFAYQQAILIGLLNQDFEIVLQPPLKKSVVTQQLLNIKKIIRDNEELNVYDFVERRGKQRIEYDKMHGVAENTAERRYSFNKLIEMENLLLDILRELGYSFKTQTTPGKNYSLKVETFDSIFKDNVLIFNSQEIANKGQLINEYLCGEVNFQKEFHLNIEQENVKRILLN